MYVRGNGPRRFLGFLAVDRRRLKTDKRPKSEHQAHPEPAGEHDAWPEHVKRKSVKALLDQHADIERQQDSDLGGQRDAEHFRADGHFAIGQDRDQHDGDQRPQLPCQMDVQDIAEGDMPKYASAPRIPIVAAL